MENFITGKLSQMLFQLSTYRSFAGYPGCEFQIRAALADVVGQEKSDFFFDKVSFSVNEIVKQNFHVFFR